MAEVDRVSGNCRMCDGKGEVWSDDLAGLHEMIDCPECETAAERAVVRVEARLAAREADGCSYVRIADVRAALDTERDLT